MKSLRARFEAVKDKNTNYSDYLCFAEAIRGRKFSKLVIHRWFNLLVEKEDYNRVDKRDLLGYLVYISNKLEDDRN
ncbi:MAG: hypothetical protein ACYC5G_01070 [Candidatus Doudnabacteria bacterium]